MSASPHSAAARQAPVFAALGDETRLLLLTRLSAGSPRSIAQLTEGSGLTRQAITKHLRVLEGVGLVYGTREGRESRYTLEPHVLDEAKAALDSISARWDDALARLKSFVED